MLTGIFLKISSLATQKFGTLERHIKEQKPNTGIPRKSVLCSWISNAKLHMYLYVFDIHGIFRFPQQQILYILN